MAQALSAPDGEALSEPPLVAVGDQGIDLREERTTNAFTPNRWQQPPPPPSGTYDPSALISFDDLPLWVQRLHENTAGTASVRAVPQAPAFELPSARSSVGSVAIRGEVATPDATGIALIEESFGAPLLPESDLSLTRFFWIAGTALVLIVATLLVLFG